ncbi:sugar ABC transporter permease [Actinosynnema pretiosum subsp. pretiosum]|uniref:Sugar ABC transporter permease n=1 Tax=Actinosynnema pretiosum subsp. pretiosum TaxID=103721 RepID=A0AA45L948_9PSEU|nr:ABC sugar transporter, inner membrane subunit [Actinosynnema pretiosum subsp. pretiosum]QUF05050.1 sugar ABC transporter permease [Actinosynnema pretiosum subsp. pretiosum]
MLRTRTALALVAPAVLLYAALLLYPAVRGVALSFTDARGVVGGRVVGLDNYRALLADPAVGAALRNTLLFTLVVVVAQNGVALLLAHWLHRVPSVRSLTRVALLVPSTTAVVVVGYVWAQVYSPVGGPLDALLGALGLDELRRVWLGDPATALPAIAVATVWMYLGHATVIFLAGYLAVPTPVFEAAELDGARGWRRFWHVDWPLLAPALTINVTLSVIGSLRVFDLPFVMTGGGPGDATRTLSLLVYESSFRDYRFGYGTAVATALLGVTVVASLVITLVLRRREVTW